MFAGGGSLAAGLAARGWVDNYILHVVPVTLGGGSRLFPLGQKQDLKLLEHRPYDDGVLQLHYEVVR